MFIPSTYLPTCSYFIKNNKKYLSGGILNSARVRYLLMYCVKYFIISVEEEEEE